MLNNAISCSTSSCKVDWECITEHVWLRPKCAWLVFLGLTTVQVCVCFNWPNHMRMEIKPLKKIHVSVWSKWRPSADADCLKKMRGRSHHWSPGLLVLMVLLRFYGFGVPTSSNRTVSHAKCAFAIFVLIGQHAHFLVLVRANMYPQKSQFLIVRIKVGLHSSHKMQCHIFREL